jgi:hypothetical protein
MATPPEASSERLRGQLKNIGRIFSLSLGVADSEIDNFAMLVMVHAFADRLLSLALAHSLAGDRPDQQLDRIVDSIADLSFTKRVDLAENLGILASDPANDLREVNRMRNNLLHWRPRKSTGFGVLGDISDSATMRLLERASGGLHPLINFPPDGWAAAKLRGAPRQGSG